MKGSSKPEKFFPLVQDVVTFLETNAPSRVKRVSQATVLCADSFRTYGTKYGAIIGGRRPENMPENVL